MKRNSLILFGLLLFGLFSPLLDNQAFAVEATGGTITYDGAYKIHTFTSSGTFTVTSGGSVDYLVVAGGGAGDGGGGGAGGFLNGTTTVTTQAYSITVGAGGTNPVLATGAATNGGNSVFSSFTAVGGGYGGYGAVNGPNTGGSGGGGSLGFAGAAGTASQGNAGGGGIDNVRHGGGGGAGGNGGDGDGSKGGNGGIGLSTSINGTSVMYACGGGGGGNTFGTGGCSSASDGTNTAVPSNSSPNSGSGGGGSYNDTSGGSGGSGIVIIRYLPANTPDAVDDLTSTGQTFGSVDLAWTQPELNGGNLTGYLVNYTTPWGKPNTTLTNNTESSDTSVTVSGLNIGTQYTFGVSPWTEGGTNSTHPPMTWLNVTTQGNFTIGSAIFNQTNTSVLPITFEEQSINSTAKFLNVTYANTFTLNCDFHYKFANTNQTYYSLTGTAVSTTLDETSFIFNDFENEIIDVYCYDAVTLTDADYLLVQNDFPLLQQIASFRAGDYGTDGKIGVFDFITIAVIIFSMIGLNRVNEAVGAVFNIALLGALAYFEIIELPTIIFGVIAVVLVFAITSTRKT